MGSRFFFLDFFFFLTTPPSSTLPDLGVFSPPALGVFLNCLAPMAQLPVSRLSTSTEPAEKAGSFLETSSAFLRSNLA